MVEEFDHHSVGVAAGQALRIEHNNHKIYLRQKDDSIH